jgi:hypothetical protein
MKPVTSTLVAGLVLGILWLGFAQEPERKKPKPKPAPAVPSQAPRAVKKGAPELAAIDLKGEILALKDEKKQRDFPVVCQESAGHLVFAYIEHDGTSDVLWLGRQSDGALKAQVPVSEPGIVHQPAIAVDGTGTVWCFWGQTGKDAIVHLMGRPVKDGVPGEAVTLARSEGSDSFADSGTDAKGRVWVTWQSMRAGEGDIFARFYDPESAKWSDEIAVGIEAGGDWEPRIAFAGEPECAWILYDSSRGNEFNLYLAKVSVEGTEATYPVAHSERYEARGDIGATNDGKGLWIAAERGRVRWGLDVRGHENTKGLNAQKEILFGRFDLASKAFNELPLGPAGEAGTPVNLPAVGVDRAGRPWVAYRYFTGDRWQIAVTYWNATERQWHARRRLPDSAMGQDRRASFVIGDEGGLWLNWPSDLRTNKSCRVSGVFLAQLDTEKEFLPAKPPGAPVDLTNEAFAASQSTPERPPNERHQWTHDGETYTLVWGDVHRHTDVSNCRTGFDGCIVEQFRYAYDMAKLDFLGTSDHTDIGKTYHPYEWWHNQRLHDVFHSPEKFVSLYVYEREQRWPWGHRNIIFAQRGGPIVYINRALYRNSQWQAEFPVKAGLGEIDPPELWSILRQYGKPVAAISHTGATGMGTDWGRYDEAPIDHSIENVVEIYQGARVSYEGQGAPQPTVGLRPGEKYTADADGPKPEPPASIETFGKFDPGTYQNALRHGRRLGVFASSDHISQHVSYGGVYVKDFTREGIIEAFKARRTIAATDKIYLEFVCNGEPLGSIFESAEPPTLTIRVDGTAPLKRVTLVRNEENYKVFEDIGGHAFDVTYTDGNPLVGEEARYYLRVEQTDGNMAWSSPVWVTVRK